MWCSSMARLRAFWVDLSLVSGGHLRNHFHDWASLQCIGCEEHPCCCPICFYSRKVVHSRFRANLNDGFKDNRIHFGQQVKIKINPLLIDKPIYLYSEPRSINRYSKVLIVLSRCLGCRRWSLCWRITTILIGSWSILIRMSDWSPLESRLVWTIPFWLSMRWLISGWRLMLWLTRTLLVRSTRWWQTTFWLIVSLRTCTSRRRVFLRLICLLVLKRMRICGWYWELHRKTNSSTSRWWRMRWLISLLLRKKLNICWLNEECTGWDFCIRCWIVWIQRRWECWMSRISFGVCRVGRYSWRKRRFSFW